MSVFEYNENWDEFFSTYWNKQPVVIKNVNSIYHLSSESLYKSLVTTCNTDTINNNIQIKLYANNNQVIQNLYENLPASNIENFEKLAEVIKNNHQTDTFTFYMNGLLSNHPEIWLKFYQFLREISLKHRLDYKNVDFEVFAGRYQSTAGGIHQEMCSNFHFVVHGKKTMRVWPPHVFANDSFKKYQINSERYLMSSNYQNYLEQSIPLTGEAGDILYWPATFWHVGESPEISASVNLALYMQDNSFELLMNNLQESLNDKKIEQPGFSNEISAYLTSLQKAVNTPTFHNKLLQAKLEKFTSLGLEKIPLKSPEPITDDQTFYTSSNPIQFFAINNNEMFYGVFGHLFRIEKNSFHLELFKWLNSIKQTSINEIKEKLAVPYPTLSEVMTNLQRAHWIRV